MNVRDEQTDGRTDGRLTIATPRLRASRGRKRQLRELKM